MAGQELGLNACARKARRCAKVRPRRERSARISQAASGTVDSARVSTVAREILLVFAGVALVTALVTFTPSPLLTDYGNLVLSAVFLFGALTLARRHGGARRFGIDLC